MPWAVALPVVARCAKRDGVVEDGSLRGDRPKVRYSWRLGGAFLLVAVLSGSCPKPLGRRLRW